MPAFDPTVTLGNLLTMFGIMVGIWATAAKLYSAIDKRLSIFESVLKSHAETLLAHSVRMEKQDDLLLRLSGDLQRILGRIEASPIFQEVKKDIS